MSHAASETSQTANPTDNPGEPPRADATSCEGEDDVTHPNFNPLKALYSDNVKLPVPNAKVLDNISKCAILIPGLGAAAKARAQAEARKKKDAATRTKDHMVPRREKVTVTRGQGIEALTSQVKSSVVAMFAECMEKGWRVKVWIRKYRGFRGTLDGRLVAYDRLCNLILADVTETYAVWREVDKGLPKNPMTPCLVRNSITEPRPIDPSVMDDKCAELASNRQVADVRVRHLHQMLVRGENIVMVAQLKG